MRTLAAAALTAVLLAAGSAQAALTVTFDAGPPSDPYVEQGFTFDPARIVAGNCASGNCLALNPNETTVMTRGGASFDLLGLTFNLLGRGGGQGGGNTLVVTETGTTNAVELGLADFPNNALQTVGFADLGARFENVTSITFSKLAGGNVRVDDIVATPLPGALPLLAAALGGLAWMRRRA